MNYQELFNWFSKLLTGQLSKNDKDYNNTDSDNLNFETDSLRFMFEAYLTEYNAVRREVELHTELHERNINYLLLIIGATFSLSGFTDFSDNKLFQFLNLYPFLYLVFALISLIFPILYIMRSVYVVTLENYQRHVLAPKIAAITSSLSSHSSSVKEFILWEKKSFPSQLQSPMRWLDYSAQRKYRENGTLFFLFGLFRYIFVGFPSFCFVFAFFATSKNQYLQLVKFHLLHVQRLLPCKKLPEKYLPPLRQYLLNHINAPNQVTNKHQFSSFFHKWHFNNFSF